MKTTKITSVISAALIIFGMIAVSSGLNANKGIVNSVPVDKATITYVVNISPANGMDVLMPGYVIVLTDNKGKVVGTPKVIVPGSWTYTFQEQGPAYGTRTARLVRPPHTTGPVILYKDASIRGPFDAGGIYSITLYPYFVPNLGNVNPIQ